MPHLPVTTPSPGTASGAVTAAPPGTASVAVTAAPPGTASIAVTAAPPGTASVAVTAAPPGTASVAVTAAPPRKASVAVTAVPPGTASIAVTAAPPGTASFAVIAVPPGTSSVAVTAAPHGTASVAVTAAPPSTASVAVTAVPPGTASVAVITAPPGTASIAVTAAPPRTASVAVTAAPPGTASIAVTAAPKVGMTPASTTTPAGGSPVVGLLNDRAYIRWLKATRALNLTVDVLRKFCDIEMKKLHQVLVGLCGGTPCPGTCSCSDAKYMGGKWSINCPNTVCSKWLKEIDVRRAQHSTRLTMSNADIRQWPLQHWQVAKVYMGTGQDPSSVKSSDTDGSGLIQLVRNCKYFAKIVDITKADAVSIYLFCLFIACNKKK